jgi:hypothetical protein
MVAHSQPTQEEQKACARCRWAGTCLPLADLQSLVINRAGLEAEYGWDVFSFIAAAKEQHRIASAHGCVVLPRVRQMAKQLAPTLYIPEDNHTGAGGNM